MAQTSLCRQTRRPQGKGSGRLLTAFAGGATHGLDGPVSRKLGVPLSSGSPRQHTRHASTSDPCRLQPGEQRGVKARSLPQKSTDERLGRASAVLRLGNLELTLWGVRSAKIRLTTR
eukprot:1181925-Prorocentrum_minimum.AAC.3